ncbi:unnamed protein product [Linum trigynum]|uniref:Uncharacterized protein n=1 Tax=Linum trigynum TaxID=586398 RepID=A0AAV2DGL4_9ROSI
MLPTAHIYTHRARGGSPPRHHLIKCFVPSLLSEAPTTLSGFCRLAGAHRRGTTCQPGPLWPLVLCLHAYAAWSAMGFAGFFSWPIALGYFHLTGLFLSPFSNALNNSGLLLLAHGLGLPSPKWALLGPL